MFQDESIGQDFVTESNEHLAHSLENVMELVRNRALVPTAETVDLLLRSCDQLKSLINDLDHSNSADVTSLVTALEGVASMSSNHGQEPSSHDPLPAPLPALEIKPPVVVASVAPPESPVVEVDEVRNVSVTNNGAAATTPVVAQNAPAQADANIRVSVGLLDRLMNLAGELVLSRNQLLQAVSSLGRPEVETISSRLDQVASELQEAVMPTRMQPLANVFGRFPGVVRDLSAKLGKQCELASAKANQVEPFTYVRDLLVQLSGHSPPAAAALLPDAWSAAHPEARRCWSR